MSCPEREELATRFRAAFADFSDAVREQRAKIPPAEEAQERSAEALKACESLWAELQAHQSRHKCWPVGV